MRRRSPLALALLGLALTACAAGGAPDAPVDPDDPATPAGPDASDPVLRIVDGSAIDGPGISVADALARGPRDEVVLVNGALFIDPDGTVRLCDAIAESFPPQCGGDRIVVQGLTSEMVGGLQTEGDVAWAESVTLAGSIE